MNKITNGRIIKLVRHKGFGFIDPEEGDHDGDIFFHHSNLENAYFEDLSQGDEVEFEVNMTDKGPEAVNIQKVGLVDDEVFLDEDAKDEPAKEGEIADEHLGW